MGGGEWEARELRDTEHHCSIATCCIRGQLNMYWKCNGYLCLVFERLSQLSHSQGPHSGLGMVHPQDQRPTGARKNLHRPTNTYADCQQTSNHNKKTDVSKTSLSVDEVNHAPDWNARCSERSV